MRISHVFVHKKQDRGRQIDIAAFIDWHGVRHRFGRDVLAAAAPTGITIMVYQSGTNRLERTMSEQNHQRLAVLAKQLVETHMAAAFCATEISAEINAEMQMVQAAPAESDRRQHRPLLDESRLCVIWRDRMVHLGYTISYRILDYLARRPTQYVRQLDMIHEIWDDEHLEFSTVRSSVRNLRKRLCSGGMEDLAHAIRGHNGRYILDL